MASKGPSIENAKDLTAKEFARKLKTFQSDEELKKYERYFPRDKRDGDKFIGVRMGQVFELAKEFIDMPAAEIEKLMESPVHEMRAGALSIMGQCAKGRKCSPERLKELYELYLRRHDRVNNWDLVDLAAHHVVGRYLADRSRRVLDKLARSKDKWERRTAIVATAHFILKLREVDDTFRIAEILIDDEEDFVNKGTGWMLRAAGEVDRERLTGFLAGNAATMPRIALRAALEHYEKDERERFLKMKQP